MVDNFRRFEAGPDPFGRMWKVEFKWLQNAITIRHSDSVDVKFMISNGEDWEEKVIALMHPDLIALANKHGRPLTDPWCMKLAALHLKEAIETSEDIEKTIITPGLDDLERHDRALKEAPAV
jgi:hypothetical protein